MAKKGTVIKYKKGKEILRRNIPLLTWDDWAKARKKKK